MTPEKPQLRASAAATRPQPRTLSPTRSFVQLTDVNGSRLPDSVLRQNVFQLVDTLRELGAPRKSACSDMQGGTRILAKNYPTRMEHVPTNRRYRPSFQGAYPRQLLQDEHSWRAFEHQTLAQRTRRASRALEGKDVESKRESEEQRTLKHPEEGSHSTDVKSMCSDTHDVVLDTSELAEQS